MKHHRVISGILLSVLLFAGCGASSLSSVSSQETMSESVSETVTESVTESITESVTESETGLETESTTIWPVEEEEPMPYPGEGLETISNNQEGHYEFQPHIFSSCYVTQFGEGMRDAFFAYCDAVRNGEDSFPCPDQETAAWCQGRLSTYFLPAAARCVETGACVDGVASIIYLIPKEEFLEREREFEEMITAILNDCLSDDYSDFEKILALYEYMTTRYTYDYDMYERNDENWMERQSPYRCLMEKQGICWELAGLYNYLLLQVGIDSDTIGGFIHRPDEVPDGHMWVIVTLDGKTYHIDPTFGLSEVYSQLRYFMMNDEAREEQGTFSRDEFDLAAAGDQTNQYFDFHADSADYSELWEGVYLGMDRTSREVVYLDGNDETRRFSYA